MHFSAATKFVESWFKMNLCIILTHIKVSVVKDGLWIICTRNIIENEFKNIKNLIKIIACAPSLFCDEAMKRQIDFGLDVSRNVFLPNLLPQGCEQSHLAAVRGNQKAPG